ncbi:putative ABC transporter permease subunit [Clostridium sardiniense]|uniref:putative ABC transporter permease subunit n=1 Tax=Clostridium sardiniense TaxID=29369 RepID=UPI003D34B9FD
MNRIKMATKFFLKNALGEMFNNKTSGTLMMALMLGLVLLFSAPICIMIGTTYEGFKAINQEGYLISFILFMGSATTFLMGIYTVLNVFFFSEDIEVLMPMPFKASDIMIGKFAVTLLNMYVYTCIIILPLIAYGLQANMGVLYYVFAIIIIIVNPILPLMLCLLISLIVMRFTNISRHKDMFKTISGVIAIAFIVLINFFSNRGASATGTIEGLLKKSNGLMETMNGIFFTNIFGANALLYSNEGKGIINLVLLIVATLILTFILYYIGDKLYFKSIVGMSETVGKREKILENNKEYIKEKSPLVTLAIKDVKMIFRTPTFFINCVVMIIYMPAIFFVAFLGNGVSLGNEAFGSMVIVGGSVLFMALTIAGGSAASTCISREGKNLMVLKYIPIDYKTQIKSKILSSIMINCIGFLIGVFILIYFDAPIMAFIMSLILQALTIVMVSVIGVYMDYSSPKLDWEDEKALFNKNFKPLIMFLIFIPIGAILTWLAFMIINIYIIFALNVAIILLVTIISYKMLMKNGPKLYDKV